MIIELHDLGIAFKRCQEAGYRFSAFGGALVITNAEDKKHSMELVDGKVLNLDRRQTRICFDDDGRIR